MVYRGLHYEAPVIVCRSITDSMFDARWLQGNFVMKILFSASILHYYNMETKV